MRSPCCEVFGPRVPVSGSGSWAAPAAGGGGAGNGSGSSSASVLCFGGISGSSADGLGEKGLLVLIGLRRQLLETPLRYRHPATAPFRGPRVSESWSFKFAMLFLIVANSLSLSITIPSSRWRSSNCILWCSRNCSTILTVFNEFLPLFKACWWVLPLLVVFHSVMNPATPIDVCCSSFTDITRY